MKPLAGRAALVTGGGRGVGRAISRLLAAEGATVGVNYRRDGEAAESLVAEIAADGGQAFALRASLDSLEEVDALASSALEALGDLDILVCNAGIASRGLSVLETTAEEVQRVMAVHTLSAHRLVHLLLPAMRRAQRADVVVISSSELLQMRANGAPYNMAKAALEAFAMTLAHEEARHGVRVNIVHPHFTRTERYQGRLEHAARTEGLDLEAAEADSGFPISSLRIDGGMADNEVFVEALADAIGRPVEISPVLEATTLGAGLLAGLAIGTYADEDEIAETFTPRRTVEPRLDDATRLAVRERWLAARSKAEATIPELSGISF